MCIEAGPTSQDAVIKSIYASPGLQCTPQGFVNNFFLALEKFRPLIKICIQKLSILIYVHVNLSGQVSHNLTNKNKNDGKRAEVDGSL
jgi:hypothetical protein